MLLKNGTLFLVFILFWLLMTFLQVKHGNIDTGKILDGAILFGVPSVSFLLSILWSTEDQILKRVLWSVLVACAHFVLVQLFALTLGMWFYSLIGGTK